MTGVARCLAFALLLAGAAHADGIHGPDWPVLDHKTFDSKVVAPPPADLLAELRQGRMVVFFRHASTPKQDEPTIRDFTTCGQQRLLHASGRDEAAAIGEAWRRLGIPVGRVLASPYCRCMDSARLAFGKAEATDTVRDSGQPEVARGYFADPVPPGGNFVIVAHGGAMKLFGEEFLREGEAMVVRPRGEGRYDLVARVRAEDWAGFLLAAH